MIDHEWFVEMEGEHLWQLRALCLGSEAQNCAQPSTQSLCFYHAEEVKTGYFGSSRWDNMLNISFNIAPIFLCSMLCLTEQQSGDLQPLTAVMKQKQMMIYWPTQRKPVRKIPPCAAISSS